MKNLIGILRLLNISERLILDLEIILFLDMKIVSYKI